MEADCTYPERLSPEENRDTGIVTDAPTGFGAPPSGTGTPMQLEPHGTRRGFPFPLLCRRTIPAVDLLFLSKGVIGSRLGLLVVLIRRSMVLMDRVSRSRRSAVTSCASRTASSRRWLGQTVVLICRDLITDRELSGRIWWSGCDLAAAEAVAAARAGHQLLLRSG